jgi:hypothetical protein
MPTSIAIVLFMLFVSAAAVIVINLTGDPGIDYWDLDGKNKPPASKLDVLRNKGVFYGAGAVLIGSVFAYLLLRG